MGHRGPGAAGLRRRAAAAVDPASARRSRRVFDRDGTALLRDNQPVADLAWPLSLDPPDTRVDVGRAGLALVAFIVAYHLASGKAAATGRLARSAPSGVAAVAIGLGHRILGVGKLYGAFTPSRYGRCWSGPFVNPNHTAELLELAAFVCLACSFQRPTALNRVGWLVGMLLCAGGAAATLSRGAVFALSRWPSLVFVFLRYFAADGRSGRPASAVLARPGASFSSVLLVLGAGVLGADQLVERFKTDAVSTDVRLHLWRDGLRVFAAHPMGIGRGAFDRVFPIYRSVKMPFPLRFAFVENEPLQLLIDCGWFFSLLIARSPLAVVAWRIVRQRSPRQDRGRARLPGCSRCSSTAPSTSVWRRWASCSPSRRSCGTTSSADSAVAGRGVGSRKPGAKWAVVGAGLRRY